MSDGKGSGYGKSSGGDGGVKGGSPYGGKGSGKSKGKSEEPKGKGKGSKASEPDVPNSLLLELTRLMDAARAEITRLRAVIVDLATRVAELEEQLEAFEH